MGDEDRPDKLKVILSAENTVYGLTHMLFEVVDGAIDRPKAKHLLKTVLDDQKAVIIVFANGKRRLYVPKEMRHLIPQNIKDKVKLR